MPHPLENLCGLGKPLKAEAPDANEIAGLLRTGIARLHDARTPIWRWKAGLTWPTTQRTH